jgi:hypothetical protein
MFDWWRVRSFFIMNTTVPNMQRMRASRLCQIPFERLWRLARTADARRYAPAPTINSMRSLLILCALMAAAGGSLAQTEPYPIPLEDRVAQATLIVVGKLRDPGGFSRPAQSCRIEVEQVLFGNIPTNKTLVVSYSATARFTPRITHDIQHHSYICFVTSEGVEQESSATYVTRAVGRSRYSHDGFELATDKALRDVKDLVEAKKKKK